jgi:hypothetical protein
MRRREFVSLAAGAAAAWPVGARAQQPAMPVIGFVDGSSADVSADRVRAFRQGLGEIGYVEGQNVTVESCVARAQAYPTRPVRIVVGIQPAMEPTSLRD